MKQIKFKVNKPPFINSPYKNLKDKDFYYKNFYDLKCKKKTNIKIK